MNWRKLYPGLSWLCNYPGYILICCTCASATIGILYLQDPFKKYFQYFPALASLLYFTHRSAYMAYYGVTLSKNELIAYLFILSTGVALLGQKMLGMDFIDQNNVSSWTFTFNAWVYNVFYFFAGAACTQAKYKKSNFVALVMVLLVVLPLLSALKGSLFLDYYQLKVKTGDDNLSHLYISEWCVFLFFSAFAFSGKSVRPIIIVIAFASLFALQGRSSTLFTVFSLLLFSFLLDGRKVVYTALVCVLLGVAVYIFIPVEDLIFGANDRAIERMALSGEDGDNSLGGRADIFSLSIGYLPQAMLFGDPTFIASQMGRMGSYIHNLLSMWQFFGLLPFLLMVMMLFRSLLVAKSLIKRDALSVVDEVACLLIIYVVVSAILSKSIIFYWLWFATGYWMLRYATHSGVRLAGSKSSPLGRKRKRKRRRRSSSFPG